MYLNKTERRSFCPQYCDKRNVPKDIRLLYIKRGQLVECGRQDLVGKYVGWMAKNVEENFEIN